jgi:CRISPR-associated protein Cas2
MKLWFVEPKPNVFVSGIKDSVAVTVIEYLHKHCPPESGIVMFRSLPIPPGYEVRTIGPTRKTLTVISGLQLVIETLKSQ